ncbi:hypothetical protein N752_28750 [Desulforamulus aquiferis]|nr:hypothetical protein [Desulforamulus aquiferis]RYD01567.1 hypothetical protein N752_28750 [Desulforamulus aquiferis]
MNESKVSNEIFQTIEAKHREQGRNVVYVARKGQVLGVLAISDPIRPKMKNQLIS